MSAYRIAVAGQSAMFERGFAVVPSPGDIFQMASGSWFQIDGVMHDPVGAHAPEWLIQAHAVQAHGWSETPWR
ncbi:hypothetical protein [Sphingomonas sp.]|uniref:hypothetical protein n=1 Tax=Sphingomonas sp. TaxID=28214 RepID=UPI001ECEB878|nr:hypothetical protein [Sphingomonas sp.]MBX3594788.1 hypothetical protein [Sphingomonas sp.]